jgi:rSAM-associated Gly-rich repeat protein
LKILTTKSGLVGLLMVLSSLTPSEATSLVNSQATDNSVQPTVNNRLDTISAALRQRENQLQDNSQSVPSELSKFKDNPEVAGFGNFRNSRDRWRNGGWRNWRNGWRDGGGFVNFRNW